MGETTGDPYGDDKHDKGNGVLHKYGYTALVVATEYCSMYCRHCFRKRLVGLPNDQTVQNFKGAADYIAAHPEISNVVVSGGDPMMLPTSILREMLDTLRAIPHLNFVRIGTRTPVVYPLRYQDDELIDYLAEFNRDKTLYVPTHFNHPNEITPESTAAVARLRGAGITVNNQAVLLRGINDDEDTLVELMSGLTRIGVNPYYLYQCMPVSRVRHHFQLPLKQGVDMVDRVRNRLDGYAKRFKFILGHDIGKIEICGRIDDKLILKQIHARVEEQDQAARMMIRRLDDHPAGWMTWRRWRSSNRTHRRAESCYSLPEPAPSGAGFIMLGSGTHCLVSDSQALAQAPGLTALTITGTRGSGNFTAPDRANARADSDILAQVLRIISSHFSSLYSGCFSTNSSM